VSTTISPVTQTALVDVNNASINEIPLYVAFGSINNKVPARIIDKKLKIKSCAGFKYVRVKFNFNSKNSLINDKMTAKTTQVGLAKIKSVLNASPIKIYKKRMSKE
jgi:hypothetical protein